MKSAATFRPPYRYEASEHGPVTIYDSVDVGWIARVKESLPHKEALAAAMVEGLNAAAGRVTEREGARLLTGGSGDESDAGSIPAPSALHTDSTDLQTCGDSGSAAKIDGRDLDHLRAEAEAALLAYAKALVWWNEPGFEHSALTLRGMVSRVIEEARDAKP